MGRSSDALRRFPPSLRGTGMSALHRPCDDPSSDMDVWICRCRLGRGCRPRRLEGAEDRPDLDDAVSHCAGRPGHSLHGLLEGCCLEQREAGDWKVGVHKCAHRRADSGALGVPDLGWRPDRADYGALRGQSPVMCMRLVPQRLADHVVAFGVSISDCQERRHESFLLRHCVRQTKLRQWPSGQRFAELVE